MMADGPIGFGLDQCRSFAPTGSGDRLIHDPPYRQYVVSVDRNSRHPVGSGASGHLRIQGGHRKRGGRGIKVVFTEKDGGRFLHSGKIQALVKGTVIYRTITEKGDGNLIGFSYPSPDAHANRMWNTRPNNAIGPEDPESRVIKMHAPTPPSATTRLLGVKLRHQGSCRHAFR